MFCALSCCARLIKISLKAADERIAAVEAERQKRLWLMRALSLGMAILVLATSAVQTLNDFLGFVDPPQLMSALGIVVAIVEVIFEYMVRRRMPLVDGRSPHLIEIRRKIAELQPILALLEVMQRRPGYVAEL